MRLLKFTALNVYGYLNFNIDFNKDISFIVGANGSGKSTAIKLIQSLFTLDLRELTSIPFESLDLTYEDKMKKQRITSSKDKILLKIIHGDENEPLEIPIINKEEYITSEYNDEFYSHIERELLTKKTYKKIRATIPPVFLGLDRKSYGLESELYDTDLGILNRKDLYTHRKMMSRKNLAITGSLAEALLSVQMILQEQYRKIREFEDKQSVYLRDRILKSSFKFSSFSDIDINENKLNWQDKKNILKRREEITDAVKK
ncbi:hypothetical protein [Dickeya sp. ws52]|uniref:hypothetical protein n=1 Tax=Dickeya sp. ws52 TaxID=2576377 RepID=UPI00117EA2C2|nr:hypothetical protein [Dickeya sp. ws52]TYL41279.1 hypothetical protein FDP13_18850 [Dickeya sp. ws52]